MLRDFTLEKKKKKENGCTQCTQLAAGRAKAARSAMNTALTNSSRRRLTVAMKPHGVQRKGAHVHPVYHSGGVWRCCGM
jgi:hypothetical protein